MGKGVRQKIASSLRRCVGCGNQAERWLGAVGWLCALLLSACSGGGEQTAVVDSLCERAYEWRYRSLDSTEYYARLAIKAAPDYADGQLEATCHLAFVAAMRMDYPEAERLYGYVLAGTRNTLLQLTAQVGMMRVCQRLGANKDFYDYHSGALTSIRRLTADEEAMNAHQKRLWRAAQTDLHLQLCTYYYYLRQEEEAAEEFEWFAARMSLFEGDSAQFAMLHYLRGNVRNTDQRLRDDNLSDLRIALRVAKERGYTYLWAKAMSSILQNEALSQEQTDVPLRGRGGELLAAFGAYGSLFDVSQTYLLLGYCWLDVDADSSLHYMQLALDQVSEHHRRMYPEDTAFVALLPADSLLGAESEEMRWIRSAEIVSLPEWMADVREGLCLAYSALGMKEASDCNRNIYLDILDATRQDRRMEQRLGALEREERIVDRGIVAAAVGSLLLLALLAWLVRRVRKRHAQHYEREQEALEREMANVVARSDASFASLAEYGESLDDERRANEQRIDAYKRQWVDKLTCLSIVHAITPFLDRIIYEVNKQRPRFDYIVELADRINLYNDILTHWIKVRQGAVALHIETFALQPLFDILAKSAHLFNRRAVTFRVEETHLTVKADRALTLFMMNTLLDNARKFTPAGGSVSLSAAEGDGWVEISVADTGIGIREEDVRLLTQEKVYDPKRIGVSENSTKKGHGFGLMNCRGIIEKYRKTSPLFSVCSWGVESSVGEGSRFFFRLPKGVAKVLGALAAVLLSGMPSQAHDRRTITDATADMPVVEYLPTDSLLICADSCAFMAYDANVYGEYEQALVAVDSACQWLNRYYLRSHPDGDRLMRLFATDSMPEITLWKEGFDTDYHIILDIRNEAAIAALALCRWDVYYYNNEIYNRLYKLMAQDTSLEAYCQAVSQANANKRALLLFVCVVALLVLLAYYVVYYRMHILTMFDMRQILELGQEILSCTDDSRLACILQQGINPIRRTDGVCLLFHGGDLRFSDGCPAQEYLAHMVRETLASDNDEPVSRYEGRIRLFPLVLNGCAETPRKIGVLAVVLHTSSGRKDDDRLLRLIARHTAMNIYYSTVRTERLRMNIEMKEDEQRRVQAEAEAVHVQNMVLDNCLSTIKHETMYYPSRIRQIAVNLQRTAELTAEDIASLAELTSYYKEVFTLLSSCATTLLEKPLLRRVHIPLTNVAEYAAKTTAHLAKKSGIAIEWTQEEEQASALTDRSLVYYLLDNLVAAALSTHEPTEAGVRKMHLAFACEEKFITFALRFDAAPQTPEQLHDLFYPESLAPEGQVGKVGGAHYLIAKQIVRLHDDFIRRGCRIELRNVPGGLQAEVTLPA